MEGPPGVGVDVSWTKRLRPRKEHGSSSGKGAVHVGFGGSASPARAEEPIVEINEVCKVES